MKPQATPQMNNEENVKRKKGSNQTKDPREQRNKRESLEMPAALTL
jgi:hypothetical protein